MISQPTSSPSSSPSKAPSNSPTNTPTGAPSLSPNDGGGVCTVTNVDDLGFPTDCNGCAEKPYCCKRDAGAGNDLLGKCTPEDSVSSCKAGPASGNTCEQLPSEEGGDVTDTPCTGSTTLYEAEDYGGSGVTAKDEPWTGFTGTGYIDYDFNSGSYLEFTGVSGVGEGTPAVEDGGRCSLKVRYANGSGSDRQGKVTVNGAPPELDGNPISDILEFPNSGDWENWVDSNTIGPFDCDMDSMNTIRITADGTPGPNLDNMEVTVSNAAGDGDDDIVCCVIGKGSNQYGTCTFLDACDPGVIPDTPTSSPTFDECEEPSSKSGKSGAPSTGKSGKSNSNRMLGKEDIVPYGV